MIAAWYSAASKGSPDFLTKAEEFVTKIHCIRKY